MENIIIPKENNFEEIKNKFYAQGLGSLHVIADFDNTLTKAFIAGEKTQSIIAQLREKNYLSEDYIKKAKELFETYHPYEKDPTITEETRKAKMREWWTLHFSILIKEGLSKKDLRKIIKSKTIELREGYKEFFNLLNKQGIPLIIMSASGIGDIIKMYLEENKVNYDNVYIITNKFEWDENEIAKDFKEPIIHSANKEEHTLDNLPIYYELLNRKNVLLLGDSKNDTKMAEGFPYKNIIKIGFLNDKVEELLEYYENNYDVIITDDGSLDFINNFLKNFEGIC